jgi:hypothetical protein
MTPTKAISLIDTHILQVDDLPNPEKFNDLEAAIACLRSTIASEATVVGYNKKRLISLVSLAETQMKLSKAGGYSKISTILSEEADQIEWLHRVFEEVA